MVGKKTTSKKGGASLFSGNWTMRVDEMILHLVRLCGIAALILVCVIYPFFPGAYDGLAMTLSTMAQTFGVLGVLLIGPVGVLWLAYELRVQARRKRHIQVRARRYYFALASVIASSIVAAVVSLVAFAVGGSSFGILTFALWLYIVSRLIPGRKLLRSVESEKLNPAPLYLVFIPIAVLLCQLTFAAPATEFSRNRAIAGAAELINGIEEYHGRHGRYPTHLSAVWKDYHPSVVGIDKFHYAPSGDAYSLFFEQPRFLLDNIGTREFVVYNKLEEHFMISHTAWILRSTPEELETRQGWYAVHHASSPHWRYFWFD
jgi:hypothetical protein